jgi:hypothetical protein
MVRHQPRYWAKADALRTHLPLATAGYHELQYLRCLMTLTGREEGLSLPCGTTPNGSGLHFNDLIKEHQAIFLTVIPFQLLTVLIEKRRLKFPML